MNDKASLVNSLETYLAETYSLFELFEIKRDEFANVLLDAKLDLDESVETVSQLALLSDSCDQPFLSFLESQKFYPLTLNQKNLKILLCSSKLMELTYPKDVRLLSLDDPKYRFFELSNDMAKKRLQNSFPNVINSTVVIPSSANVAQHSVVIEKNVIIESNVTIYERVVLKSGCIVRAGAVVGSPGFEYKNNGKSILPVVHDGITIIGEEVEIGPGSIIGQGFYKRPTILGYQVKTDNLVSIAHGSLVGDRTLIAAGAVIAGSVRIGNDSWIGPGAVVSNGLVLGSNSFVALGSHVFKDVQEGDRVIGSPARSLPRREK